MREFFIPFFRLLKLCLQGREGLIGLAQFIFVFVLSLMGLFISLRLIRWSADFYNALQAVDAAGISYQIGLFVLLTAGSASLYLIAKYVQNLLEIRWRKILTETILERWLENHNHWRLTLNTDNTTHIDNPDQRIAEDCRIYVQRMSSEVLDLIMAVISVVSYFVVLWGLSTFALSFSLIGFNIEINHYMVWAAPVYVVLASGLTHLLGAPLKRLTVEQQKKKLISVLH